MNQDVIMENFNPTNELVEAVKRQLDSEKNAKRKARNKRKALKRKLKK